MGDAKTSTVVLLDNSYSMEASRAGTSNWALARDEAVRIVSELKNGSEAAVVLMSEGGASLLDVKRHRIDQVDDVTESGQPGRVDAGPAADVEDGKLDGREVARDDLLGPRQLQPTEAREQALILLIAVIVAANCWIE